MIKYRVDVINAESHKDVKQYRVPCGMNSIVATGLKPITAQFFSIPTGKVAIYSVWNEANRDWTVTRAIHSI